MAESTKKTIALQEYYFLQNEVGRFDDITHRIKNWSITVSFALIGAGFYQKNPVIFLLAAIVSALFWVTEARWKRYQRIHMSRLEVIENYLLGSDEKYEGPAIRKNFLDRLGSWQHGVSEEWKAAMLRNVQLPHNLIAIVGIALFIVFQFDFVSLPNPVK